MQGSRQYDIKFVEVAVLCIHSALSGVDEDEARDSLCGRMNSYIRMFQAELFSIENGKQHGCWNNAHPLNLALA